MESSGNPIWIWNEKIAPLLGAPRIKRLSEERRKKLALRMKEYPDFWAQLEKEAAQVEEWFRQQSFGTFDWLMKPRNLTKFFEGNYRKKKEAAPANWRRYEEPPYEPAPREVGQAAIRDYLDKVKRES